eukprot:Lankesteria_metandrocarpae@DN2069_c0_g1_i1.p1
MDLFCLSSPEIRNDRTLMTERSASGLSLNSSPAGSDCIKHRQQLFDSDQSSTAVGDITSLSESSPCSEDSAFSDRGAFPNIVEDAPQVSEISLQTELYSFMKQHSILLGIFIVFHIAAAILLPPLDEIETSGKHPIVQKYVQHQFFQFLESSANSHPFIHSSLKDHLRNGCAFAMLHLLIIFFCALRGRNFPAVSNSFAPRLYGALCFMSLVAHLSAYVFGGLSGKNVFFPDIWLYIFSKWLYASPLDLNAHGWIPSNPSVFFQNQDSLWFQGVRRLSSSLTSFPYEMESLESKHLLINVCRSLRAIPSALSKIVVTASFHLSSQHMISPNLIFRVIGDSIKLMMFIGVGLVIDIKGAMLHLAAARKFAKKRDATLAIAFMAVVMFVASLYLEDAPGCVGSDAHWYPFEESNGHPKSKIRSTAYDYDKSQPPLLISKYVAMKDGVELSVDVFLPRRYVQRVLGDERTEDDMTCKATGDTDPTESTWEDFDQQQNLYSMPTFVEITRYNRRMTVLWPFSMLRLWGQPRGATANVYNYQLVQALTANDYVVVVADTRGTGSSFGKRNLDFSEEEVSDFAQLVTWVRSQFWSDGKIAAGGISYDGMTGLHAASLGNVSAVAALFTPVFRYASQYSSG